MTAWQPPPPAPPKQPYPPQQAQNPYRYDQSEQRRLESSAVAQPPPPFPTPPIRRVPGDNAASAVPVETSLASMRLNGDASSSAFPPPPVPNHTSLQHQHGSVVPHGTVAPLPSPPPAPPIRPAAQAVNTHQTPPQRMTSVHPAATSSMHHPHAFHAVPPPSSAHHHVPPSGYNGGSSTSQFQQYPPPPAAVAVGPYLTIRPDAVAAAAPTYQQQHAPPRPPYQQQQTQQGQYHLHHPPPPPPPPPPGGPPAATTQQHYPANTIHPTKPRPPPPPQRTLPPHGTMNGQDATGLLPNKPRVDPTKVPRPPLFTRPQDDGDDQQTIPIYFPRRALQTGPKQPPPPADSRFVTFDDGNASPQLIRSTIYAIPVDRNVLRKSIGDNSSSSNLMGLLCTPLAIASEDYVPRKRVVLPTRHQGKHDVDDDDDDEWRDAQRIPIINVESDSSPPRCDRCHAYVNPFWTREGKCNFCGTRSNLQQQSTTTIPTMATQYGTVEYQVGGAYITRRPAVAPIALYALDATCPHLPVYVTMVRNLGRSIRQHYCRQELDSDVGVEVSPRIGCCLVGSFGIVLAHFDDKGVLGLSVMSDITEEPFAPLPLDLWTYDMSTEDGLGQWESLMDQLWDAWQPFLEKLDQQSQYGPNAHSLSCGGAALAFMADALQSSGGRATLLSWRRPNFGVGAIRDREMMNTANYTKEKTEHALYTPLQLQSKLADKLDQKTAAFYKQLGATCAKNRVCVDILIHTRPKTVPFLDIATLGELCRMTSGRTKWIRSRRWQEEMQEELRRPLLSFCGRDAVFKLRCSDGLQVKSYLSSTAPGVTIENGIAESPELEMSVVDPTTCVAVSLEHRVGGIPKRAPVAYFQSALLYTTSSGKRRVRVSTLALMTSSEPSEVFLSVDFSALTALWTRQTIAELWNPLSDTDAPLQKARVDVTSICVDLLTNYRHHTSLYSAALGQLILPDRLKLLPLFCMSFLKSVMLRSSLPKRGSGIRAVKPSPTADERAYGLFYGSSVVPALTMLLVHPNVFPITNMEGDEGEWQIPQYSVAASEIERAAAHFYIKLPATVSPSIACLEDDCVYLVDDGFTIFVYVGKNVPSNVSDELLTTDGDGNFEVSKDSDFGKRIHRVLWQMQTFCAVGEGSEATLRPTVAPVEVVFGSENHQDPLEERMMTLMVDDSSSNEYNYVDFLMRIHKSVKSRCQG